jgi:hypothetical protein
MRAAALVVGLRSRARFGGAMRAAGLLIALLTTGCMATLKGGPDRLYTAAQEVEIAQQLLPGLMAQYYDSKVDTERMFFRNEVIARRMYVADVMYTEFEKGLTRERQEFGFITAATTQGLTTGSVLAASLSSAKILAGLAGAVNATRSIYDSELIIAKTLQILEAQMRSQRDIVAKRILERMDKSSITYPLSAALSDVEDYHRAGTLNSGLIKAAGEAGVAAADAAAQRTAVLQGTFDPNETTQKEYQEYLMPGGVLNPARLTLLNKCVRRLNVRNSEGRLADARVYIRIRESAGTRSLLLTCAQRDEARS